MLVVSKNGANLYQKINMQIFFQLFFLRKKSLYFHILTKIYQLTIYHTFDFQGFNSRKNSLMC